MKNKKFTLVELIAVIVILGVIAVVAIPKYLSFYERAADAMADDIFAKAQTACGINYAKGLLKKPDHVPITNGKTLYDCMTLLVNDDDDPYTRDDKYSDYDGGVWIELNSGGLAPKLKVHIRHKWYIIKIESSESENSMANLSMKALYK